MTEPIIYWLRNDLRLRDNPALTSAAAKGPVLPLYIYHEPPQEEWSLGGASRWWLYHALTGLQSNDAYRQHLICEMGDPLAILRKWIKQTGARTIVWNRVYEPRAIQRDTAIKAHLQKDGMTVLSFNGSLLNEPWEVKTLSGQPYKVYTPYAKACFSRNYPSVLPVPPQLTLWEGGGGKFDLENTLLPSQPDWSGGLKDFWDPTEKGCQSRITHLSHILPDYKKLRDIPSCDGTSRLSPYLHFGQVSPRILWHKIRERMVIEPGCAEGGECFLRELLWREFSYYLLYYFPDLPDKPWNDRFTKFPWSKDQEKLRMWQKGTTGYPLIDAGLRQLWQTGWMHNRVRMIVASFLIKDLMIPWQQGEAWFWDTLVDADIANNAAGWQWVAGSGADASPYFRIFNPTTQSKKFDPKGKYIKDYVPELTHLDPKYVHEPWLAPEHELKAAGIILDENYPRPIVEHDQVRKEALFAYKSTVLV